MNQKINANTTPQHTRNDTFGNTEELNCSYKQSDLSFAQLKNNSELSFENFKQVQNIVKKKEVPLENNSTRQKRTRT